MFCNMIVLFCNLFVLYFVCLVIFFFAVSELSELLDLYSEVHQRFGVQLKEFQNEFKTILEGEQALTSALNRMNDTQRRKQKIINQIEEAQTKEDNCLEDLRKLWGKLDEIKQQIRQVRILNILYSLVIFNNVYPV